MHARRIQTIPEEIANTATHGIGFLLVLVLFPLLMTKGVQSDFRGYPIALSIFGFGLFTVFLSSTLYHAIQNTHAKGLIRIWDHISIFFLIGGTYTPIVWKFTPPATATLFLGTMWGLIVLGSTLKIFFIKKHEKLSVAIYVAIGFLGLFIIRPLTAHLPLEIFWWILAGGIAYLVGVIFYRWKKLPYQHAIWHLFVLTGAICHYVAIYKVS